MTDIRPSLVDEPSAGLSPEDRRAGLRAAPRRPGTGLEASCPSTRTSSRPWRLSMTSQMPSRWDRSVARVTNQAFADQPRGIIRRRPAGSVRLPHGRRLACGLVADAGLAWLPWAASEYQTHAPTTRRYYVILAVGGTSSPAIPASSRSPITPSPASGPTLGDARPLCRVPLVWGSGPGRGRGSDGPGSGHPCLRMRAINLALATWVFAESVRLLITVEYEVTRGDLGRRRISVRHAALEGRRLRVPPFAVAAVPVAGRSCTRGRHLLPRSETTRKRRRSWGGDLQVEAVVFAVSAAFVATAGGLQGHYVGLLSLNR